MDARDMGWCVRALGAALVQGDASKAVAGVSTDSRRAGPGDVFVARLTAAGDGATQSV